jgi:PAT family beta-lactamase induction signal transducer AmpG
VTVRRGPNPLLYFVLFLPFGATGGFVTVAVAYLATHANMSISAVAALAAMTLVPHTYKFLWAPVTDAIWTRKGWYCTASLVSSITLTAIGFVSIRQENLRLLEVLIFITSLASTFLGMSVEAIMAHATPEAERGRAAGWSQAGNLGGSGIGGGIGLWLALHLPRLWMATGLLGAMLLACAIAVFALPEPKKEMGTVAQRGKQAMKDLWEVLWSRNGAVAVALCFLPMGAGAASGLFSGVSKDWGASADLVEWMNGWLSGLVMILGCLAGGRLSDAMNRKAAYPTAGALLALVALTAGLAPRSPMTYATLCIAYAFATGVCYGTFTSFVLEVIGGGAAATKYNTFASLSNFPIWYMTLVDGWAADKLGPGAMLLVDALAGAAGIVVLLGVVALLRRLLPAAELAVAE